MGIFRRLYCLTEVDDDGSSIPSSDVDRLYRVLDPDQDWAIPMPNYRGMRICDARSSGA